MPVVGFDSDENLAKLADREDSTALVARQKLITRTTHTTHTHDLRSHLFLPCANGTVL